MLFLRPLVGGIRTGSVPNSKYAKQNQNVRNTCYVQCTRYLKDSVLLIKIFVIFHKWIEFRFVNIHITKRIFLIINFICVENIFYKNPTTCIVFYLSINICKYTINIFYHFARLSKIFFIDYRRSNFEFFETLPMYPIMDK